MRHLLATLATLGVALPLHAQLTPEQRAAHEIRAAAQATTRDFEARQERRSLAGDQSAYAGPAGRDHWFVGRSGRRYRQDTARDQRAGGRIVYIAVPGGPRVDHGFIGQRQGRPVRLKPLGTTLLDARAGIPLMLTLEPIAGGEGVPLLIHTALSPAGADPVWAGTVEGEGDEADQYRIELPALRPGSYELFVQYGYPEEPTRPLISTRMQLTVWQP
jgi:hypothetical protein